MLWQRQKLYRLHVTVRSKHAESASIIALHIVTRTVEFMKPTLMQHGAYFEKNVQTCWKVCLDAWKGVHQASHKGQQASKGHPASSIVGQLVAQGMIHSNSADVYVFYVQFIYMQLSYNVRVMQLEAYCI